MTARTPGLSIGIGCRRGVPAAAIVALVETATAGLDMMGAAMLSIDRKRDEAGLLEAAVLLGLRLVFLTSDDLDAMQPRATIRSHRVREAVGVASVAEAAALIGAGPGAVLLVPRMAAGGVTCAVARGPG